MAAAVPLLLVPVERYYSASASHNGVTIEVGGFRSEAQAARVLAREMQAHGWQFRTHWWEVWKVKDPRV